MTQQSHPWAYTLRKPDLKETCTPMFIAALFIIARTWKQLKGLYIRIRKLRHSQRTPTQGRGGMMTYKKAGKMLRILCRERPLPGGQVVWVTASQFQMCPSIVCFLALRLGLCNLYIHFCSIRLCHRGCQGKIAGVEKKQAHSTCSLSVSESTTLAVLLHPASSTLATAVHSCNSNWIQFAGSPTSLN